jgi:hypothetical protein
MVSKKFRKLDVVNGSLFKTQHSLDRFPSGHYLSFDFLFSEKFHVLSCPASVPASNQTLQSVEEFNLANCWEFHHQLRFKLLQTSPSRE